MLEIFIYLQKSVNLERKTRHAVITHANTYNGTKIPTFFGKSWGMMLNLSNAPLIDEELLQGVRSYLFNFFYKLLDVLLSQESSYFSHSPRTILQLKSVPFGRY